MNLENMKQKYVEYGPILFLTGVLVYALCLIVDTLTKLLWDISYPIILYSTFIGIIFIMFGCFSFVFIGSIK